MQRKSVAFFCESVINSFTAFPALSPIFRRVRKIAKNDYYLRHVRPSACNSAPTGWILTKNRYLVIFFENLSRKFKFHLNHTRRKGTLHEGLCTVMVICHLILLRMRNISDKFVEKTKTLFLCSIRFFENLAIHEIMWKNCIQRGRPHVTIRRMCSACWIPRPTNTHSEYVMLIDFPLQQWLHERASMLLYTYSACLVCFQFQSLPFDHSAMCEIPFPRTN